MKDQERELIKVYKEKKEEEKRLKDAYERAKNEAMVAEAVLLCFMDDNNIEKTAKYADLGYVTKMKPRLYASYTKENENDVFDYLFKNGREDMIKTNVSPQSFSAFVKEQIEDGNEIPKFVSFYLKTTLKLY